MSLGSRLYRQTTPTMQSNEGARKKHMSRRPSPLSPWWSWPLSSWPVCSASAPTRCSVQQWQSPPAPPASENVRNATNDYNGLVNGDAADAAAPTEKDVKDSPPWMPSTRS